MPALHEIMNIVADAEDGGNHPPMPSVDTIIGSGVNWVDHGRYHFAKDTKPFVGFEFDYGGHEMNRWWRMRKPGYQTYSTGYYTYQMPNGWDYAGYTMIEELWTGPESAESKFRTALANLAGVIPNSMPGTGSTTFHGQPVKDLVTHLSELSTMLDTQSEKMRTAYNELDVPDGPMTGSAASAYAARLYDFALRLRDLRRQVDNNHEALKDVMDPIRRKAVALQDAVTKALNNPHSGMRRILDDWYFNVTTGREQWNSARGQFQIPIHADPPVYGIVGDDITDSNVNNELKNRWREQFEGVFTAASELYNKMEEMYKRAHTDLNIIEDPKGGLPLSMIPDINDTDNPYDDMFGDGNGEGEGPPEIKIDWGDGPPGGEGPDIPDWMEEPPPGYGGPDDLNYEGPGEGPPDYEGGPDNGGNYGSGGPGPETVRLEGPPDPGSDYPGGDGTGPGGEVPPGGVVPPPGSVAPPPPLGLNGPGDVNGPVGVNGPSDVNGPGGPGGTVPPPPGLGTDFPQGGGPVPGGVIPPPPPLGLNGPGSGGGTGRRNGGANLPPPTGLAVDPATGLPIDPDTGRPFPVDPATGRPFDPDTGLPINFDPETGRVTPIDPVTGEPVSPDGGSRLELDPETGLPIDPDTGRPFPVDPETGLPYNPDTGLPIDYDPETGQVHPVDPVTGGPVSPDPGLPITYDPETGLPLPLDPVTGEPVTGDGGTRLDMDPATGLPIDPETGRPFPVDPDTGLPYNPDTGMPIDYDPVTGLPAPVDPVTGQPLPPDSFTPPPIDPGLDTNFPGGGEDVPINPVTGEPAEVDPVTGLPYPVDPDTGEAIKGGFEGPSEEVEYPPPRFESGGPEGLNYGGYGSGNDSSGGGGGNGSDSSDRTQMFAAPTGAGGPQVQAEGGGGPGAAGAGGPGGAAGQQNMNGMGSPMMPPMMPPMGGMGGGGGAENRDRNRTTWLSEDEKVWGTDKNRQRATLGRPVPGQQKKGAQRHELIDAGADGGRTGTASHDDEGTLGRKRKPGVGNRRGRGQEQAGGRDGGRDGSSD
ncbi:hypothetical protein [Nocardiopsis sp. NPDC057823]|uniref:hypothetical protein n=1 Tax=Nocardiopsis sp. NPDC057823 TaxID=3346256 RepID=UPI00366B18F3